MHQDAQRDRARLRDIEAEKGCGRVGGCDGETVGHGPGGACRARVLNGHAGVSAALALAPGKRIGWTQNTGMRGCRPSTIWPKSAESRPRPAWGDRERRLPDAAPAAAGGG